MQKKVGLFLLHINHHFITHSKFLHFEGNNMVPLCLIDIHYNELRWQQWIFPPPTPPPPLWAVVTWWGWGALFVNQGCRINERECIYCIYLYILIYVYETSRILIFLDSNYNIHIYDFLYVSSDDDCSDTQGCLLHWATKFPARKKTRTGGTEQLIKSLFKPMRNVTSDFSDTSIRPKYYVDFNLINK